MMKKILPGILLLVIVTLFSLSASAQTDQTPKPVSASVKKSVVDSIVKKYTPWNKITVSGKLSSPLLPVSASAKIYMEKDKLTLISLSAIFVGEVGRIEIDNKEVLIVNKYNKKYLKLSLDEFKELYPGGQSELQNLLLGRVSLLGKGQLTARDTSSIEIYDTNPGYWAIIPNDDYQQPGMVYLYSVASGGMNLSQFLLVGENGEGQMLCQYNWGNAGAYTMDMEAAIGNRSFSGQFQLESPQRADKPFDRFTPDSRYTQVYSLRQLLK